MRSAATSPRRTPMLKSRSNMQPVACALCAAGNERQLKTVHHLADDGKDLRWIHVVSRTRFEDCSAPEAVDHGLDHGRFSLDHGPETLDHQRPEAVIQVSAPMEKSIFGRANLPTSSGGPGFDRCGPAVVQPVVQPKSLNSLGGPGGPVIEGSQSEYIKKTVYAK